MTINKAYLTDSIHKRSGLPKSRSSAVVGSLVEIMKAALGEGEDILISGFGKFCVKENNGRAHRNSLTSQNLMPESKNVVTFKCSQLLKQKLTK